MKRTPQERVDAYNAEARVVNKEVKKSPWAAFPAIAELLSHDPGAHRNLSEVQFKHYPGDNRGKDHILTATNPEGERVGDIKWHGRTGRVNMVYVHPNYRGLGVATTLWDKATHLSEIGHAPTPKHSDDRTLAGEEWVKTIGGNIPKLTPKRARQNQARKEAMGQ
jgi:GNAT superfamily N-acetyltransferase